MDDATHHNSNEAPPGLTGELPGIIDKPAPADPGTAYAVSHDGEPAPPTVQSASPPAHTVTAQRQAAASQALANAANALAHHRSIADCLAIERTVMANERTLLAYFRSSLAVLVVGVTIIKFFASQGMVILGYLLLVVGVACITIGLMRFTEMYHRISELGRCDSPPQNTSGPQ